MAITLRAYDRNGTRLGQTVPWSQLSRTIVRNAPGSLSAGVPLSLLTSGLLSDEVYLRIAENGVEAPDWYVLDDDGDDPADEGGAARIVTIGAKGVLKVFEWAEVYPWDHVPGGTLLGLKPQHPFNTTPGGIMAELINRAQARGAIPMVTYSFTETHDSAGTPWPSNFARVYDAGTSLFKVLQQFAEDSWADYEMTGFRLDLYVPDTALAPDFPDSVLRLGKGVTQAPRKRTRASVRSTLLAVGNEGAIIEVSDPDTVARYGRREGFEGRGTITDVGTLTAATQVSLARQTSASESITLAVDPAEAPPIPRPGGYLRYDQRRLTPTRLEPMRVQSVAWEYGEDPRLSVELADLWVDRDLRMERRIDAILNGSSANERVPLPPLGDEKPPSPVQGLSLVSGPYEDPTTGQQFAQMTATWLAVTTDVDGTPVGELLGYAIEWRQPEVSSAVNREEARAGDTARSWSPVVPGTPIEVRIAAFDRWHNHSDWSAWVRIMAGVDETPPATPTTPLVDNYLGLLRSRWDGGFGTAASPVARPADLAAVEVHASATSGFDPNADPAATRVGTLYASGAVFTNTPYGATRYVRLVAVDTTGNRSAPSPQASAATGPVVSADVFDGAIGTAKLADAAIVTAKIADLAVNDAKIGSLNVGKLIAGTMNAEVVIGGRLATALSGTRVELNSLGIFRWIKNADGTETQTVAIDNNGALITGEYRTAVSGRRIVMGSAGAEGRVTFWSPDGREGFVRAYTESSGVESIQIGMHPSGDTRIDPLWNLLNINTSTNGDYALLRSGVLEFVYDSTAPNEEGRFVVFQTSDRGVGGAVQRFFINPTEGGFTFAANQGSQLVRPGHGSQSPMTRYFTGGGYGNLIKVYHDGRGVWHEFRSWDDANWTGVRAANFEVNSDARNKREVADANLSAVALVKGARVKRYVRDHTDRATELDERGQPTGRVKPGSERRNVREEIGLLAQEAPPQIVLGDASTGMGIDVYQMASVLWSAVQELDGRLAAMERKPA